MIFISAHTTYIDTAVSVMWLIHHSVIIYSAMKTVLNAWGAALL
jgi:hypothetical protein